MINKSNVSEIIQMNKIYLDQVLICVEKVREMNIVFRYQPITAIKHYLLKNANLLMFPSENLSYGGLVTFRNGRFYIHINTRQPKVYENFLLAHEFYHFYFEGEKVQSSSIKTFLDSNIPSEKEYIANLFATELLVNHVILKVLFLEISQIYLNESLENQVLRLMHELHIPYKFLVIKLAQDGLITLNDAINIIDFDYLNNVPVDCDKSLLLPSMVIRIANVSKLLKDKTIQENLRDSDYQALTVLYEKHLHNLKKL